MTATQLTTNLVRITRQEVDECLREAWPDRESYPAATSSQMLATAINTIVDRANVAPAREKSIEAAKRQRASLVEAQKHARGLQRALIPVRDHYQSVADKLGALPPSSVFGSEPNEQTVTNDLHRALEAFLALGRPRTVRDHEDPIVWIATATKRAWQSVSETQTGSPRKPVRFGSKSTSSQVAFIELILKAIDFTPITSRETISDHLRRRQNRPRDRGKASREGAK